MAAYETRLFINNEFVPSSTNTTFPVYSPLDDSIVTQVHSASPADIDQAVASATAALKGPWSKLTGQARGQLLNKLADLVERDAAALQAAETICMGVPTMMTPFMINGLAVPIWRYYAGWCDKLAGESFPVDGEDGMIKIVKNEPIGVCAAISAWNGTMMSIAWKCAAALAAGCPIIFKSSEKSPLGTLMIGKLVLEAGFPPGVIQFVSGKGDVGGLLSSHMQIRKISFTGSVGTARKIAEAAAKSNLKKVTLELGGKSPSIVFDDADIEEALAANSQFFLVNASQGCVMGSRAFVQESIAEKFIEGLKARFEGVAQMMGDPSDPRTFLGPVADKFQSERIMGFIDAGKQAGGHVLTGGSRKDGAGNYILPTIFLNPDTSNTVYKDEIFGPVLTVTTFKTEEEALALANDTEYGLAGYIWTKSLSRALRVADSIEAGMVSINCTNTIHLGTPFGGKKESGIGKESGKEGLMAYINQKTITIKI